MTQKKLKVKKGDEVIVIAGKDKGKKGSVLSVIRGEEHNDRVVVSGVNLMKRHQKPGREGAGGIVSKEASLHISNVALLDPKENKATRVGYKLLADGKKTRIAKRSGEVIGKN